MEGKHWEGVERNSYAQPPFLSFPRYTFPVTQETVSPIGEENVEKLSRDVKFVLNAFFLPSLNPILSLSLPPHPPHTSGDILWANRNKLGPL